MKTPEIEIIVRYKNGTEKVTKQLIWYANFSFIFSDDENVECVIVNGNRCNTPDELSMFFKGVDAIRNLLINFVN